MNKEIIWAVLIIGGLGVALGSSLLEVSYKTDLAQRCQDASGASFDSQTLYCWRTEGTRIMDY